MKKTVEVARSFKSGEVIVKEGEGGSDMFIIQEGKVAITREIGGRNVVLATLERGHFFGEMSLLESLPRSATVRAIVDTKLLILKRGGLLLKMRRDPTFALEMLQHMSYRVRYISEQLSRLLARESISSGDLKSLVVDAEIESLRGEPE